MLEWKILAAAFSALLVISILLVGNTGVKDLFGGIIGKITDWMGGSPVDFPSISGGKSGANSIYLEIYPASFTLKPESNLNLTLGDSYFENFNGEVSFDFSSGKISLREKGSQLSISSPIQPFSVQLKLSRLQLKDTKFVLKSVQSNIANDNGTLDIQGFAGIFSLGNSSIILEGNVTKITGDGWAVG